MLSLSLKGTEHNCYMRPHPNYNNWPSIFLVVTLVLNFLATFFNRHLTEQQPSYICTRQKIFPIRNVTRGPWAYVSPPPDRAVRGSFHQLWGRMCSAAIMLNFSCQVASTPCVIIRRMPACNGCNARLCSALPSLTPCHGISRSGLRGRAPHVSRICGPENVVTGVNRGGS